MANQRSPNQKNITLWLDNDFVKAMDIARNKNNEGRSLFIRRATAEYLSKIGQPINKEWIAAPDRAGKGGPKPKEKAEPKPRGRPRKKPDTEQGPEGSNESKDE